MEFNMFNYIVQHLEKKKNKFGYSGLSKPTVSYITCSNNVYLMTIEYNYYDVVITYDSKKVYAPYSINITIDNFGMRLPGGSSVVGEHWYVNSWHTQEDIWIDLQQHWKKTLK